MREFELYGIVDVGTYNTILDPAVALDNFAEDMDEDVIEAEWERFSNELYMDKVLGLAEVELKKLIAKLPAKYHIQYVEQSAKIDSPKFYNYRNDELIFKVTATGRWTSEKLQEYIEAKLAVDINDEFNATYHIYEKLCRDHSAGEFSKANKIEI